MCKVSRGVCQVLPVPNKAEANKQAPGKKRFRKHLPSALLQPLAETAWVRCSRPVDRCDRQKCQRELRARPSGISAFRRSSFVWWRVGGWRLTQATPGPLAALRLAALLIIHRPRLPSVCVFIYFFFRGGETKRREKHRERQDISKCPRGSAETRWN